jgi:hypothetical protein
LSTYPIVVLSINAQILIQLNRNIRTEPACLTEALAEAYRRAVSF